MGIEIIMLMEILPTIVERLPGAVRAQVEGVTRAPENGVLLPHVVPGATDLVSAWVELVNRTTLFIAEETQLDHA
jgi:hypothetical protein